jgi:hypothetical protein
MSQCAHLPGESRGRDALPPAREGGPAAPRSAMYPNPRVPEQGGLAPAAASTTTAPLDAGTAVARRLVAAHQIQTSFATRPRLPHEPQPRRSPGPQSGAPTRPTCGGAARQIVAVVVESAASVATCVTERCVEVLVKNAEFRPIACVPEVAVGPILSIGSISSRAAPAQSPWFARARLPRVPCGRQPARHTQYFALEGVLGGCACGGSSARR